MNKIIWKNIDSNTIKGLVICNLPPITKPKLRVERVTVDGVDGDIINELGYESYDKTIEIGLTYNYDINEIIKYFSGSGKLILSNEIDKYYNAKIIEKVDYERLLNFKKANVKFHIQPFKYLVNETEYIINVKNETEFKVSNIGLEKSKPIFHLFGTGKINLYVNNIQIFEYTFDSDEEVIIDSDKQDAYLENNLKNINMLGEFPILECGVNLISWSGNLTKLIIKPNSRWL